MAKPWKTTGRVRNRRSGEVTDVPISVEIDWGGIADALARRASENKSGKAGLFNGLIKAKIIKP